MGPKFGVGPIIKFNTSLAAASLCRQRSNDLRNGRVVQRSIDSETFSPSCSFTVDLKHVNSSTTVLRIPGSTSSRDSGTTATSMMGKLRPGFSASALLVVICAFLSTVSAFDCGKPGSLCGGAIPEGVSCPKGPGWCEAGHYCGYDESEKRKCLPLPPDCGQLDKECCPSNKDTPHTKPDDRSTRMPTCKEGLTCLYDPTGTGMAGDPFTGRTGEYLCADVPADCGSGPGKPCCPNLYRLEGNPPIKVSSCGSNTFCVKSASTWSTDVPGTSTKKLNFEGTCYANTPDCGQFGKPCCVSEGGSSTAIRCGSQSGKPGRGKGYCVDESGVGPRKPLVCRPCPDAIGPDAPSDCK